jgi:hypothetical protein
LGVLVGLADVEEDGAVPDLLGAGRIDLSY